MQKVSVGLMAVFSSLLGPTITAQITPPSQAGQEIQRRRAEADLQRRMNDMRTLEQRLRVATRKTPTVPSEPKLSNEERQRVLSLRRVERADVVRYDSLLREPKTGIFKLFPDLDCVTKNVVRVSKDCESFVPMSSSFTFRTNSYSDELYHDIHFESDQIASKSFFSQGIITSVGKSRLEDLGLSHNAAAFLSTFQPALKWHEAADHAKQFRSGIESGGYRYSDKVVPEVDTTYLMRIIAYRLENGLAPLTEQTTLTEMMFHSLAFDKRLDLIVAFRVLRRHDDGAITIVWKELIRDEAPKIRFEKKQGLKDFKPIE